MRHLRSLITYTLCFMLLNINITFDKQQIALNLAGVNTYAQSESQSEGEKVKTIELEGEKDNFLTGGAGSLLILLTASYFVMNLYKNKEFIGSMPNDITAAAISSGVFVAAEVYAAMKSNKELEKKMVEYTTRTESGELDEAQVAALQAEKDVMDEIADVADAKSKFQNAVAAGFLIAAGLAIYAQATNVTGALNCSSAALAATSSGATLSGMMEKYTLATATPKAPLSPQSVMSLEACGEIAPMVKLKETEDGVIEKSTANDTKLKAYISKIALDVSSCLSTSAAVDLDMKMIDAACAAHSAGPTSIACQNAGALAKGAEGIFTAAANKAVNACKQYEIVNTLNNGQVAIKPVTTSTRGESAPGLFAVVLSAIISNAYAGKSQTNQLAILVGLISAHYLDIAWMIDPFISSPEKRAWVWGALGAYAKLVASNTSKQADTARENSRKLGILINKMENSRETPTQSAAAVKRMSLSKVNLNGLSAIGLPEALPCIGGQEKTASDGSTTCPPLPSKVVSYKTAGNVPSNLSGGMSNLASLGNSLQGASEITAAAQQSAVNLAQKQGAISKTNNKLRGVVSKLNKALGVKGKKGDDKVKSVIAGLNKAFNKTSNKQGAFANYSPRKGQYELSDSTTKEKKDDEKSIGAKAVKMNPAGNNIGTSGKNVFDFGLDDMNDKLDEKNAEFAKNEKAAQEIEAENAGDIIKDKNVSIFKAISNRYLRSGFNRLLKKIE